MRLEHKLRLLRHVLLATAVMVPALVLAQVFTTPKGEAQNVRFEQMAGGTIHIFYDLVSTDPQAVFDVSLEASPDSGGSWTLRPQSVTGDVGPKVRPGPGKRIVWDWGKDVERVEIDRFRFRIVALAGPLTPAGGGATVGALTIVSDPPGAQVTIDGTLRGRTPLDLKDLPIGTRRIVISQAGFLENSRTVDVTAGSNPRVEVRLTPSQGPAAPRVTTTVPQTSSGGGGATKWILIGGGAAAAAGAAIALGGDDGNTSTVPPTVQSTTSIPANRAPSISNATLSPIGVLAAATLVTLEVTASDPDNDAMTATWSPGDSTPPLQVTLAAGRGVITKQFNNAGNFTGTVSVSDGRGGSDSRNTPVSVGTVSGLWTGRLGQPGCSITPPSGGCYNIRLNFVQNGSALLGDYEDGFGRPSRISGNIANPRQLRFSVTVGPNPIAGNGGTILFVLDVSGDLRTATGIAGENNPSVPVTITR